MMKCTRLLTLILALAAGSIACPQEQGPFEKAGEKIDEAADEAEDSVEEAGDDIEDAVE